MKLSPIIMLVSGIVILTTLAACGPAPTPAPGLSDADVAATVNAAVAATNTAQADLAATVNAAVAATSAAAVPPTATATLVVVATPTPAPDLTATANAAAAATNTPAPEQPTVAPTEAPPPPTVDTSTMSEEELAAAIDAAVTAAVAATEQAATATSSAAADNAVTNDETVSVQVTLTNAEEAIALAEALIAAYNSTYGQYAMETVTTLQEIEEDLEAIATETATIASTLDQGSEAATAAVEQLQAAATAASASAAEAQAQAQSWLTALKTELDNRAATALATQPTEVATDRQGAVQSAFKYIDAVRSGLDDGKITQGELSGIAQAGANASASLKAHGGPQLQNVAGSIDNLTQQVARGELPQAKRSVDTLESSLPRRP
jgi:hypothetical protein